VGTNSTRARERERERERESETVRMDTLRRVADSIERIVLGDASSSSASTSFALPRTDVHVVSEAIRLYGETMRAHENGRASDEDVRAARFRMVWALAHAEEKRYNARAVQILTAWEEAEGEEAWKEAFGESATRRDGYFLSACAKFHVKDFEGARERAFAALREDPECRQAAALREAAENALMRDGLIGAGALAATGLAVIGAAALASKR
jgi:fission 1 protein